MFRSAVRVYPWRAPFSERITQEHADRVRLAVAVGLSTDADGYWRPDQLALGALADRAEAAAGFAAEQAAKSAGHGSAPSTPHKLPLHVHFDTLAVHHPESSMAPALSTNGSAVSARQPSSGAKPRAGGRPRSGPASERTTPAKRAGNRRCGSAGVSSARRAFALG
jgi:hypothetical protein